MMKPIFNNINNKLIQSVDGDKHWISRSVAVVGVHIILHNDDIYILIERRSDIMDEPYKWCLPCGYLDWNESGYEAVIRETYEETNFYVPTYKKQIIFNNGKEPFIVTSDPSTSDNQNVSLSYIFVYRVKDIPLYVEKCRNTEIMEVKWLNLKDFLNEEDRVWAFNHKEKIQLVIKKFLS